MTDSNDIIFAYTRIQALEDGVLVDATDAAREVGIRFPVALTQEVHATCVAVPEGASGQDERGRLHDIVWMLRCELGRRPSPPRFPFTVLNRNDDREPKPVELHAVLSFEQHSEGDVRPGPVFTVMFPHED